MMDTWESLFNESALEDGHSEEFVAECLSYAEKLHQQNLPVIFDFVHLPLYLGCTFEELKGLVSDVERHYVDYHIRKKTGGFRLIEAPDYVLKDVQRWIYINILCKDKRIPDCVNGFMPRFMVADKTRSILSNAAPHSGHDWLINIDLKNFFHTVTLTMVDNYFGELGYEDEVTKTLVALCTRKSRLPQGAPTSPMLSNLIASKMDLDMISFCKKRGITYTRYADDMSFSGCYGSEPLLNELYDIVFKHGFIVNRQKTKVRNRGYKQTVTGLTVTNGVHVPKSYRKELWRELHFCKRFGPYEHVRYMKNEKGLYKDWLRGRIMYVRQIDPACGNQMLAVFNELNWLV